MAALPLLQLPVETGDPVMDLRELKRCLAEYFNGLERSDAISLDISSIVGSTTSWTPSDASGATLSFTSVSGSYLLFGGMVVAWGALTYPATADASNVKIGGLPIKVRNTTDSQGGGTISYCTETTAARVLPFANNTYVDIRNTGGTILTNATMSGDTIYFCVMYPY